MKANHLILAFAWALPTQIAAIRDLSQHTGADMESEAKAYVGQVFKKPGLLAQNQKLHRDLSPDHSGGLDSNDPLPKIQSSHAHRNLAGAAGAAVVIIAGSEASPGSANALQTGVDSLSYDTRIALGTVLTVASGALVCVTTGLAIYICCRREKKKKLEAQALEGSQCHQTHSLPPNAHLVGQQTGVPHGSKVTTAEHRPGDYSLHPPSELDKHAQDRIVELQDFKKQLGTQRNRHAANEQAAPKYYLQAATAMSTKIPNDLFPGSIGKKPPVR